MSNDLSTLWIQGALEEETEKLNKMATAYSVLKNHQTSYADGILKMIKLREQVVAIWRTAAAEIKERAECCLTNPVEEKK